MLSFRALNYGSIGTILGHELTHGFDDSGRMFDKNGNLVQWWSNDTISEYINRTECFIDQYSHYYLPDIEEYVGRQHWNILKEVIEHVCILFRSMAI